MLDRLIKIFLSGGGIILIGFGIFCAMLFFLQKPLLENLESVAVLIGLGVVSLIVGIALSREKTA